jgi:ketosteroid isomerase-like protein
MPTEHEALNHLAEQVGCALDAADLASFSDLLDPDVQWGSPVDPSPACQSREQVLAWYRRGHESGIRGRVAEVTVLDDRLLVGLKVTDGERPEEIGGEVDRWQILTVSAGRVVDIVGFEDRSEALAYRATPRNVQR